MSSLENYLLLCYSIAFAPSTLLFHSGDRGSTQGGATNLVLPTAVSNTSTYPPRQSATYQVRAYPLLRSHFLPQPIAIRFPEVRGCYAGIVLKVRNGAGCF